MEPTEQEQQHEFPVVGIGGSAGGLVAAQHFFAHMAADSGMAFVVILHLSPEYESNLAAVIQQATSMPVMQVTETVTVEANHVYVISPNKELFMVDGQIELADPKKPRGQRAPIDLFFRTLAESHWRNAAAIVLSGTGADGSIGLPRVKENGGIALVQDPLEAEYDAMPRNAIATGLVDLVLPVAAMAERLVAYWHDVDDIQLPSTETLPSAGKDDETIRAIFALMRTRTGHDFSQYKLPTVMRRIGRRMLVRSVTSLPEYLAILRSQTDETQSLLRDLLISVTNFFRDPDAWQALEQVIPRLFAEKQNNDPVRVWVVGCATGEEAYTIAMLLYEYAETLPYRPNIQIFATDIDEDAIAHARQGLYLNTIASDITPERLGRFFVPEQGRYRVRREIRDTVLFAVHNVLHDPPFSRLDLITCRNVLIYLNRTVQEQVLQLFHFTLRADGFLLLGSSESTDGVSGLFAPIDKAQRFYTRRLVPASAPPAVPSLPINAIGRNRHEIVRSAELATPSFDELDLYVLANVGPPVAIVNEHYEIVYLARGAGQFLKMADGEPSHNLLKVVQRDLRLELRTALFTAAKQNETVETRDIAVEIEGERRLIQITVQPIDTPEWARGYIAVIFRRFASAGEQAVEATTDAEPVVRQLEEELQRTKDQLRATIEQYETVVEEYKAANEELQAINEELRAASEELETSKEELQSVNEELTTVNQELKHKIEEVSQSNNDLQNFMASTDIGTIFVDRELRIKRYTPSIAAIFNLIPADTNRPLAHVTHNLTYDNLPQDAQQVLATLIPVERELRNSQGRWYLVRLQPYRTTTDLINGVVLSFIDITERRRAEHALRESEERLQLTLQATSTGTFLYHIQEDRGEPDARMLALFGLPPGDTLNLAKALATLIHPDDRARYAEDIARATNPAGSGALHSDIRVVHKDGGLHWIEVTAQAVFEGEPRRATLMYGVAADITERKRAEEAVRESEERFHLFVTAASEIVYRMSADWSEMISLEGKGFLADTQNPSMTWLEEYIPPSDKSLVQAAVAEAIRAKTMFELEHHVIRANGTVGSMFSRAIPFLDDHGELVEWFGAASDITERKQAEAALRESQHFVEGVITSLPVAIYIFDLDERKNIFLSPQVFELFGYTVEDMQASGTQLLPMFFHPDDLPRLDAYFRAIRGSTEVRVTSIECRMRHKQRGWIWVVCRDTIYARDANGLPTQLLGTAEDISQRRQAEESLRANEERVRLVINSVHDYAIFTINPDGTFESWNIGAEQVFGYTQAEVLGNNWRMIFTAEDLASDAPQREIEQALAKETVDEERWHVRKNGSTFFASGVLTSVIAAGKVRWFVKVLRDLTERKQNEQALEERVNERTIALSETNAVLQTEVEQRRVAEQGRQEILRQLVTAQEAERQRIARELHDQLGQQLSALRLGLGALHTTVAARSMQSESIERLQRLAAELDEDVDQLALELRPSVLDNFGILAALQQHVDEWAGRTGIQAEFQRSGSIPERFASEVEIVLYRVVQEALTNVLKHANAHHVSVIVEQHDSQIQVIVEDDGQGFDPETVSQSADARRKLGLLGMQERVALVGGTATIESEPGSGTTIYFRVPL